MRRVGHRVPSQISTLRWAGADSFRLHKNLNLSLPQRLGDVAFSARSCEDCACVCWTSGVASHFVYLQYSVVHNIISILEVQRFWVYTFPAHGYSRFMQSGLRTHAPSPSCKVYSVHCLEQCFSSLFFSFF